MLLLKRVKIILLYKMIYWKHKYPPPPQIFVDQVNKDFVAVVEHCSSLREKLLAVLNIDTNRAVQAKTSSSSVELSIDAANISSQKMKVKNWKIASAIWISAHPRWKLMVAFLISTVCLSLEGNQCFFYFRKCLSKVWCGQ